MCGRFTLRTPLTRLVKQLRLPGIPEQEPRYNIAPTQPVAAVREARGERELAMLRWGLIPAWGEDAKVGNRWINARSETADTTAPFRAAFRRRRCLMLADGFYEWKKNGRAKQPYYIHAADGQPFAFAGLWECWRGADPPVESCTILTTEANERIAPLHDRMPVILSADAYDLWLDQGFEDTSELKRLLVPRASDALELHPVSPSVNRATYDAPDCIDPVPAQATLPGYESC